MKRIIGVPTTKKVNGERPKPEPKPPKPKPPPPPDLPEIVAKTDVKADELEKKIASCDVDLRAIGARIRSVPEGSMKATLKKKALAILQRKRRFDEQLETLRQQSFNMDQGSIAIQSTKDAITSVKAMKKGIKELKKAQKKVNVDDIEDLHEELEQLLDKTEDMHEVLGNSFNVPELDDKELEEQLELLGDEYVADDNSSYLDAANTAGSSGIAKSGVDSLKISSGRKTRSRSGTRDPVAHDTDNLAE